MCKGPEAEKLDTFVRQKIDQLGEERVGRPAGQVEDRNLGLILGGPLEDGKPRRETVQGWIAFSKRLWAAAAARRSSREAGRLSCPPQSDGVL